MAKQTWESCIYTAEEERDFVNLGPTKKMLDLETKNYRLGS
jgi:glucosylceramidase